MNSEEHSGNVLALLTLPLFDQGVRSKVLLGQVGEQCQLGLPLNVGRVILAILTPLYPYVICILSHDKPQYFSHLCKYWNVEPTMSAIYLE